MPTAPSAPLLHTSAIFLTVRPTADTDPSTMWSVVAKCEPYLEHGERLKNIAWRCQSLKQPRNRFTQFVSSLSAAHHVRPHEVVQHNTSTPTRHATADSRTTTPTLINGCSYDDDDEDEDEDEDEDDLYTDDDEFYDEDDDSIICGPPSKPSVQSQTSKDVDQDGVFEKKIVHSKPPMRSLLSDMLASQKRLSHASPPHQVLSLSIQSSSASTLSFALPAPPSGYPHHHLMGDQELSESLSRNVCREQTSQFCGKLALPNQHPSKPNCANVTEAAGWLGSFRGW